MNLHRSSQAGVQPLSPYPKASPRNAKKDNQKAHLMKTLVTTKENTRELLLPLHSHLKSRIPDLSVQEGGPNSKSALPHPTYSLLFPR